MADAKTKEEKVVEYTVFQGMQPLRTFSDRSLAQAFANDVKLQACKQGVDCSSKEHSVTIV